MFLGFRGEKYNQTQCEVKAVKIGNAGPLNADLLCYLDAHSQSNSNCGHMSGTYQACKGLVDCGWSHGCDYKQSAMRALSEATDLCLSILKVLISTYELSLGFLKHNNPSDNSLTLYI